MHIIRPNIPFSPLTTVCTLINLADPACYASPRDTHGPVVQTGSTRGQNRSRNKNGRWRKKRSDTGTPRRRST